MQCIFLTGLELKISLKFCAMSDKREYSKPDGESAELLNKYFLTKFRTGYVKCKDVVLPEYFRDFGDRIREMDVRFDDIWVCSFPKTGENICFIFTYF